jgi:integrase
MARELLGDNPEKYLKDAGPNGTGKRHPDGKGLYLQVAAPGQGSWMVRFGEQWRSLGPFDLFTPEQVRARHLALYQKKKAGFDPIAIIDGDKAAKAITTAVAQGLEPAGEGAEETFGILLDEYVSKLARQWKSGAGGSEEVNWRNMFAKVPALLRLPIAEVTPKAAAAAATIFEDNRPTQKRMRKRIRSVLKYADTREIKGKKHKVKHLAALAARDFPALMVELAAIDSPAARALAFTLHTLPRSGVTLQATWSEITEVDGLPTWIIPQGHVKTEEHVDDDVRIPLTAAALACLGKRPVGARGSDLIFRSRIGKRGRIGHGAMQLLLKELRPGFTVHGSTRAGFRTWVGDETNFARELGEIALGHALGDDTEQAYARGDQLEKRRPLMQAWSDYITSMQPG